MRWTVAVALATVTAIVCAAATVCAQDYPTRPVRVYVGLAAGGGTDYPARMYADRMFGGARSMAVVKEHNIKFDN